MRNICLKLATAGVLSLCSAASAFAGSVTQPGETVGLAVGAPLPQGLYFVNTGDWGNRSGVDTSLGVDIPVLAWSTPWTFLGARVQFLLAGPLVEVGVHHTNYLRGVYNPLVAGQLAWVLGITGDLATCSARTWTSIAKWHGVRPRSISGSRLAIRVINGTSPLT
jgi:hypothetical protein